MRKTKKVIDEKAVAEYIDDFRIAAIENGVRTISQLECVELADILESYDEQLRNAWLMAWDAEWRGQGVRQKLLCEMFLSMYRARTAPRD